MSRHDRRLHAGPGPWCSGLLAGATPRGPPVSATYLPFFQTVQSGGWPSCQPQWLCPLWAVPEVCNLIKIHDGAFNHNITTLSCSANRKSTFDIFNFLASQHRQLPDIGPYDDEEDEVLLKSTRSVLIAQREWWRINNKSYIYIYIF